MTALTSSCLESMTKVKVFESRSKFKVTTSKFMVYDERSCHKQSKYEIPVNTGSEVMAKVKVVHKDAHAIADVGGLIIALWTFVLASL